MDCVHGKLAGGCAECAAKRQRAVPQEVPREEYHDHLKKMMVGIKCGRVVGCTRDGNGEPLDEVICKMPAAVHVPVKISSNGFICHECASKVISLYVDAVQTTRATASALRAVFRLNPEAEAAKASDKILTAVQSLP